MSRFCSYECMSPPTGSTRIYIVDCDQCAAVFVTTRPHQKRCSMDCQRKAANAWSLDYYKRQYAKLGRTPDHMLDAAHRRRARILGRPNEKGITITYLLRRDRGRCQLCGTKVDPTKRRPVWNAPVIDHIVPIDSGGAHLKANVQLAHWSCNAAKGIKPMGEQLRLIG